MLFLIIFVFAVIFASILYYLIRMNVTVYVLEDENMQVTIGKYDKIIYANEQHRESIINMIRRISPLRTVFVIRTHNKGIVEKIVTNNNDINTYTSLAISVNSKYNMSLLVIDRKIINSVIYSTLLCVIEDKRSFILISV